MFNSIRNPSDLNVTSAEDVADLESILIRTFHETPILEEMNFNVHNCSLTRQHDTQTIIPIGISIVEQLMEVGPIAIAFVDDNNELQLNDKSL